MMLSSYLSPSRHGVYYFRWPLPTIEGQTRQTIKLSLRTRCPDRAGDLARHLASCGRVMRDNNDLTSYKRNEIREMVTAYFKAQLQQYLHWLDTRGLTQNALEDVRCEMLDHEDHLTHERDTNQYLKVRRFIRKSGISAQDWRDSQPAMQQELRKGRRDMLRAVLKAAERLEHYSYDDAPAVTIAPSPPASAPLGRAIDDFIDEHSRQWPEKTRKQVRAYLNILVEYFGSERLLEAISKQDASEVKKVLQALPASRNTKPALKALSLSEAVKVKGHRRISPKTINSHIDTFRRFFDWSERHGHAPHKLFEGMKVPKAKNAATERKPFSKEQTALIFNELTQNPSGLVRKESNKWASLLGLFTGARLNEICQLETADVQCEDSIWFLNITDEGNGMKRVKADASRRKVPLHSEMINLGFLKFVESQRSNNRLFSDYNFNANGGYGRSLGRWCNETFLPKLGLKEPSLVFHSFRHTMITRLAQANVAEPVIKGLVGHAQEGVTQASYFKEGYTLAQLKEAVDHFEA